MDERVREKLIALLSQHMRNRFAVSLADELIANGVTIPVQCKDCVDFVPKADGTIGFCKCGEVCGYLTMGRVGTDSCSYGRPKVEE